MERFKRWRNALIYRFESNKEEKEKFPMLTELMRAMPSSDLEIVENEGDQNLFVKLIMAIYQQLHKKDLIEELFDENLSHLELVEMLVQVVFFSSVQLKLTTPLPFKDDDLLQHLPGSLVHISEKKSILKTNIIGVLHGMTWKKVKELYEISVSTITCDIDTQLVKLWNNSDVTALKVRTLGSLLSELTVTSNCLQNYCSEFGYPFKQTLRLVPKNGQNELRLIVPSQTAVFRGQHFHGPRREGPFLWFELEESTMLQITVVPNNKNEELYRWSMCIYRLSEGNWNPDFRCRFDQVM